MLYQFAQLVRILVSCFCVVRNSHWTRSQPIFNTASIASDKVRHRFGFVLDSDFLLVNSADGFVLSLLTFAPVHREFGGLKRTFSSIG